MILRLATEFVTDLPRLWSVVLRAAGGFVRWASRNRGDLGLAAVIAVAAGLACSVLASMIPPALTDPKLDAWVWFEADLIRVHDIMVSRGADNHRTNVHPLQPLLMYPPTKILMELGIPDRIATITTLSGIAGVWAAVLFGAFRGMGLARLDSLIFLLFGTLTGSAIFWFPVPEVYGFGALTVLGTFACVALIGPIRATAGDRASRSGGLPGFMLPFVSALSLSMTSTNWMAGIMVFLSTQTYARAVRITFDALLIVTVLFMAQKMVFHSAQFFVPNLDHEMTFIHHDLAGGVFDKIRAFFLYAIAVPTVPFLDNPAFPDWMRLSVQVTPLTELGWLAIAGLVLWVPVLIMGAVTGLRDDLNRALTHALLGYLAFQLVLHLFYGDEMFLYSLNYVPAMLLLGGLAARSRFRSHVRVAVGLSAVAIGINNIGEFASVTSALDAHANALRLRQPGG